MGELEKMLGGLLGGKGGRSNAVGGGGGMAGALLPMLGGLLAGGGLNKLLSGLRAKGLGAQADSWVGKGPNKPVTGDQVRQVMSEDELAQIAAKLGVSHEDAAEAVAEALPQVVDHVTPEGQLPPDEDLDQAFGRLVEADSSVDRGGEPS
ncbi:MAG: DUF937 domain-containing protein [Actinobacteria bacterium]|nr:DUF937 domain-containing protein [Actinomycetota bacterium]